VFTPKFGERKLEDSKPPKVASSKGQPGKDWHQLVLRTCRNRLFFEDDVIKLHRIRERYVRLYRKGRIRVQVIVKDRRFSLFPRIVTSCIRVELMFRLRV
jgi:hypothetical protein